MVSYPMNYEIVLQLLCICIYIYMGLSDNDPYFVVVMTVVDST